MNGLLILSKPLLQFLRLVEHNSCVIGEAPLLLVRGLSDVRVRPARTYAHIRLASVSPAAALVILAEYLRYVFAGDGPD